MRHYLALLLLIMALPAYSQGGTDNAKDKQNTNPFLLPWKPPKHKMYHDTNALAWKRAGVVFSDFVGVEGQRYAFNNQDYLRYGPTERPGFVDNSQHAMNFLGVGKLPISEKLALFAKAGPSYYQPIDMAELSSNALSPINPNMYDWGITYSTGASVNLSQTVQLSLEYGHTEVDDLEMESTTAQLSWSFK